MRFFAFKKDMEMEVDAGDKRRGKSFSVDDATSVIQLKRHFFETLNAIGALIPIDERMSRKDAQALFAQPDAIFAQMHTVSRLSYWDKIPKRKLCHSLGDFLLPEIFLEPSTFSRNTMNMVTSDFQSKRLKEHLGQVAPSTAVFTPKMNEKSFYPPDAKEKTLARKNLGLSKYDIHIVYAGRWLATKGICQLLRVLNLWPDKNIKVSLVGNFTPAFPIQISATSHFTFAEYFKREFIARGPDKQVTLLPARTPDSLRELFWSSDLFVYASVHEDENFGMSPREAVLCGVPVVVTDFCGLHQIGAQMPWGCIDTYPTFGGVRYSLLQFSSLLKKASTKEGWDRQQCIKAVKTECSTALSRNNMHHAAEFLLQRPLEIIPERKVAGKQLVLDMIRYADEKIAAAFIQKEEAFIDGAYVDGTGFYNKEFSYRKFLQAIQGIYTTSNTPPVVSPGDRLRGFFRIAAWKEERAVVEFGFPGPRVKHYSDKDWRELISCVKKDQTGDIVFHPRRAGQMRLVQELIDLGYLAPDM